MPFDKIILAAYNGIATIKTPPPGEATPVRRLTTHAVDAAGRLVGIILLFSGFLRKAANLGNGCHSVVRGMNDNRLCDCLTIAGVLGVAAFFVAHFYTFSMIGG